MHIHMFKNISISLLVPSNVCFLDVHQGVCFFACFAEMGIKTSQMMVGLDEDASRLRAESSPQLQRHKPSP